MSVVWVLILAAAGASPSQAPTAPASSRAPTVGTSSADSSQSGAHSTRQLRQAVAEALRRAGSAKAADLPVAITALVDVFNELGRDQELPANERQRLGAEIRSRLARFETQFKRQMAKSAQRPADSRPGAAGGPAVEGLDTLVDLIEKTIGPDDWVLAQRIGPNGAGQGGAAGIGGQGGQAGGAFGGGLDQQAEANGQALVDLIQNTVAPDSWDIRGGPGTIIYFNPLRALVIRTTGEGHDNIGDVLGGLRK